MSHYKIPQELIDAIFDDLHAAGDRKALLACSQVCRSWLPSSQRHLFRRVTSHLNSNPVVRLGRVLPSSPHLANYIRELNVDVWPSEEACQALAVVLRTVNSLQRLELRRMDWTTLTVYLRQSLRWVVLLPSIMFVNIQSAQFGSMDNLVEFLHHTEGLTRLSLDYRISPPVLFDEPLTREDPEEPVLFDEPMTREDPEENEEEQRLDFHQRRHLTYLRLSMVDWSVSHFPSCVDWLLGPRSPSDISHVQNLHIDGVVQADGDAVNRLLHAIGSSLKHLQLCVPQDIWRERHRILYFDTSSDLGDSAGLEPNSDITLEFNSNIKFLHLGNIEITHLEDNRAPMITWLLRFFSNIDINASNQLDQIQLDVTVDGDLFGPTDCSVWEQVDCTLVGNHFKFRQLQKLDINIWGTLEIPNDDDEVRFDWIGQKIVAAHSLLAERGVSVNVHCVEISYCMVFV